MGCGRGGRELACISPNKAELSSHSHTHLKRTRQTESEATAVPATSTMKLAPCATLSAKASPAEAAPPPPPPGCQNSSQNGLPAPSVSLMPAQGVDKVEHLMVTGL